MEWMDLEEGSLIKCINWDGHIIFTEGKIYTVTITKSGVLGIVSNTGKFYSLNKVFSRFKKAFTTEITKLERALL